MNGFQIDAVNNALDELRAENARLKAARDAAMRVHVEDGAEIERLRAEMDQRMAAYIEYQERDEAEIERLRALSQNNAHSWDATVKERNELRAEIERLRALLLRHQVAAWCEEDSDLAVETRRALEPKP